jgi:PAS domain S-box-containing protein
MARNQIILSLILIIAITLSGCRVSDPSETNILDFGSVQLSSERRVLFISSYHPSFPTFQQQMDGLTAAFSEQPVVLDVEFMDSKRFSNKENLLQFENYLTFKLDKVPPYDLVITADDSALHFVLDRYERLFSEVPIVFFGVNDVEFALEQNNNPHVTGLIEAVSMRETIDLIQRLHPQIQEIVAIVDGSLSGQSDLHTFYQVSEAYPNFSFSEVSLENLEFAQFTDQLAQFNNRQAVLLLSAYTDATGKTLSFEQSLSLISENLSQPLYHLWHHGLGEGVLGGKLVDHTHHAETAAKLGLQILHGRSPGEMTVIEASPNEYFFDYPELERFGIDEAVLPLGSHIINEPVTFFQVNQRLIWFFTLIALSAISTILILSLNIDRRRRAEKSLSQALTKNDLILNSTGEGILGVDLFGKITFCNNAAEKMLGYGYNELQDREVVDICYRGMGDHLHSDLHCNHLRKGYQKRLVQEKVQEYFQMKDGAVFPVEINTYPLSSDDIEGAVITFRDLSWKEKINAELRASEEKYSSLFGTMNEAYALHKIVLNDNGTPVDYIFEEVNPAFEVLTGFKADDVIGRTVKEIIPDTESAWIDTYGQVAITGKSVRFENYASALNRHYEVIAYSPKRYHFATIFMDITDRVNMNLALEKQVSQLASLRNIDLAILNNVDFTQAFEVVVDEIEKQLGADACRIFYWDRDDNELKLGLQHGFKYPLNLHHSHPILEMIYRKRELLYIKDLKPYEQLTKQLQGEGFISMVGIPLIAKDQLKGVLSLFFRNGFTPSDEWYQLLDVYAGQTAIVIEDISLARGLQRSNMELVRAYDTTLQGWANALELRDNETEGHSRRVTDMTVELARKMGFPESDLEHIRRGAQLHDIGKMGIPDRILHKPGPLDEEEWAIMRQHPVSAYRLLKPIEYLNKALDIPYGHHERWDGSGYPQGLKREDIPISARIFAVVDVWDALSSDRPYRIAWPQEKVFGYLQENAGILFDPAVVEAFLELISSGKISDPH